jgi:hypothetical protein
VQSQTLSLLLVDHLERVEGLNISYNFHIQLLELQQGRASRLANTTSYTMNVSSAEKGVFVLEILSEGIQVALVSAAAYVVQTKFVGLHDECELFSCSDHALMYRFQARRSLCQSWSANATMVCTTCISMLLMVFMFLGIIQNQQKQLLNLLALQH